MESVSDVGGLPEERVAKDVTSEQLRGLAAARYVRAWAIIGGLGNVWLMGTDVRRWGGQFPGNISDVNICSKALGGEKKRVQPPSALCGTCISPH